MYILEICYLVRFAKRKYEKQIKYASKLNLVILKYNALEKIPVYDFLFKEIRSYL